MLKKVLAILFFILMFSSGAAFCEEIKIVHFSDIHLDTKNPDKTVRKFAQSVSMFKKAIQKTNKLKPDIVVISGDMVNKPLESEFDIFLDTAKAFDTQFYPIMGNHDVGVAGGLTKKIIIEKLNKNCPWLKLSSSNYFVVKGEYLFVFMDGTNEREITSKGTFSNEALQFLDKLLSHYSDKKAIIVQHFPLMPPFKSPSHEVTNRDEYLDVIDKHDNVIMMLSGHYHASRAIERNNVLYVSTPAMIEYPHAFRYLTVNTDKKNIIISSELIMDIDQNDKEDTTNAIARLKLGLPNDNYFVVKLKNKVPNGQISYRKLKIFSQIKSLFKAA